MAIYMNTNFEMVGTLEFLYPILDINNVIVPTQFAFQSDKESGCRGIGKKLISPTLVAHMDVIGQLSEILGEE